MTSQGGFPHPEGRNDKSENRCGRRAASANPYAISGNCYISQSADKSTHLGFIVAISASFLLRPVEIREGEIPVFWACGVTPQAAVENAKPPIVITHAPGHMFITDIPNAELNDFLEAKKQGK